jgi:hypothetical protein
MHITVLWKRAVWILGPAGSTSDIVNVGGGWYLVSKSWWIEVETCFFFIFFSIDHQMVSLDATSGGYTRGASRAMSLGVGLQSSHKVTVPTGGPTQLADYIYGVRAP